MSDNSLTHHNLHSISEDCFQSSSFSELEAKVHAYRCCIDQIFERALLEREARGGVI